MHDLQSALTPAFISCGQFGLLALGYDHVSTVQTSKASAEASGKVGCLALP